MKISSKILKKFTLDASVFADGFQLDLEDIEELVEVAYLEGLLANPKDWMTQEWEDETYATESDAWDRLYELEDKHKV